VSAVTALLPSTISLMRRRDVKGAGERALAQPIVSEIPRREFAGSDWEKLSHVVDDGDMRRPSFAPYEANRH